jgi:hypothetical protein
MRPSPGVTVLQYVLMSVAQALSTFSTLAFSLSSKVLPIDVCAEANLADERASNGKTTNATRNFEMFFIERPSDAFERNVLIDYAARYRLRYACCILTALEQA